ncbi:DUF4041 domain-containing protein [Lactiplantibacillus argentoratensis]|uniref:DUF4041 domain-containing protein n=1 Tax=Lactiplantibacillus argentoratensis TaxID=271881 RepID=UPI001D0765A1|nr:DUF4041 domain-containing protein [Lactiplantibacillus argentoratensis]MCB7463421.1 DUF4041 domain-containing protein [Lactiplantibacillus argentoratensis]
MSLGDLFRISEFKNTIQRSKLEIIQLQETIDDMKKQEDIKLSLQQMKPVKLEKLINTKEKALDELDEQIDSANEKRINVLSEIKKQSDTLNEIKADISDLSPDLEMSSYGLYQPQYDFSNSLGYKSELQEIRDQQKFLIKRKIACTFNENWQVNGSVSQGRKMIRNIVKAILRSFNNECTDAINKVTYSNYNRIETRIKRSFDQHNKMYEVDQVSINEDYLALKLAELELAFEYRQKVQEEKDKLREQRAREKEEKALQREIKSQQKMLNKEIDHYSKAIQELQEKQIENPYNQGLKDEIEQLKQKLKQYEDKKSEVDYREENATAGYVYIISNVGSFGKNVFKIGVTRRLDPMDRINELGSASVPFKFDVHALIFSENAYQLESKLHQRFSQNRVNMVNNRKEYFRISINEIEDELKKYSNLTVDFKEAPEAEEYRESLAISTESKQ